VIYQLINAFINSDELNRFYFRRPSGCYMLCVSKWPECAHYVSSQANASSQQQQQSGADAQNIFYDNNLLYKHGSMALNYNRNDTIYDNKKSMQDTEEGPEWIRELNKLISYIDGLMATIELCFINLI
jgi:hypothetical protein